MEQSAKGTDAYTVKIADCWYEVAAERCGAFRLSVAIGRRPARPRSVFLNPAWAGGGDAAGRNGGNRANEANGADGANGADDAEGADDVKGAERSPRPIEGAPAILVRDGLMVGVATAAGALLIDERTGAWTLRSAAGDTLIRPVVGTPSVHAVEGQTTESLELLLGWNRDTPVVAYGSGNGALSLQQSEGLSQVGNGLAVVPYYWSPQGYVVLAVSADDARPASWRADSARSRVVWTFPGREAHLYLVPAADLKQAMRALATLTGQAPVPPRWTFGYLQSRWGWQDRSDLERTYREFRRRGFPVDAFILDFEWYTAEPDYEVPPDGLKAFPDFSVNPQLFPEPKRQLAAYHAEGLRIVAIRKPRLGDAARLKQVRARRWTLATRDPNAASQRTWGVREMDFRVPEFRRWYAERTLPLLELGFDAWWNDEGESSYLTYYFWNEAEQTLAAQVRPRKRFWSLNRAFIPGMQRFGATAWTGDAYATWEALAATPTHLLNWGLAGMPYGGCDIGGFRGEATPELFVRWMQAGVFFPMMRAHTSFEWTPRFPWRFGVAAEEALRHALELRYRLIPFYYSLAHATHATGVPMMRPLVMEFPDDPLVANLSNQWMLGDRVLAAPLLTAGSERSVYLPGERWYRFGGDGRTLDGARVVRVVAELEEIPVFVRAGTILPLGAVVPNTAAFPGGPLTVQIYPGRDATFTLVEDDGVSTAYEEGRVRRTRFDWDDRKRVLSWRVEGSYEGSGVTAQATVGSRGDGVQQTRRGTETPPYMFRELRVEVIGERANKPGRRVRLGRNGRVRL